jgi:hypothetical protein
VRRLRICRHVRDAHRLRRCIVPVDGFFEWKAIKGQKAKQPYAIAMKDGTPFGIGGIWENWKDPTIRAFAVITTDANALVAEIHDRMPLILAPDGYGRWLAMSLIPADLMRPFPAEPMRMWPYPRGSTSRRTMMPRSSNRWNRRRMRRDEERDGAPRSRARLADLSRGNMVPAGTSKASLRPFARRPMAAVRATSAKPPSREVQSPQELRTIPAHRGRKIGPRTAKVRIETSARPLFGTHQVLVAGSWGEVQCRDTRSPTHRWPADVSRPATAGWPDGALQRTNPRAANERGRIRCGSQAKRLSCRQGKDRARDRPVSRH